MTLESPTRTAAPAYTELLRMSWWSLPATLAVDAIIGLELLMGFTGVPTWVPFVFLLPLSLFALIWWSRIRVTVDGGELRVDDARLPVSVIADVVPLNAAGKREALGVGSHPLAFILQRPFLGPAVQIVLDDPQDPTPFWVISTRHPVELATALLKARDASLR